MQLAAKILKCATLAASNILLLANATDSRIARMDLMKLVAEACAAKNGSLEEKFLRNRELGLDRRGTGRVKNFKAQNFDQNS